MDLYKGGGRNSMYYEETLFETIMTLSPTEIPYQLDRKLSRKMETKRVNEQNLIKQNNITTDLEGLYQDLIKQGTRLDITIERRVEIRKELTLIRKQKRLMEQEITRYDI